MELKIDHKKISDSPYGLHNEEMFVYKDDNSISQIVQETLFGNSSCYLVSGYRGAGKTSFLKKFQKEIKKSSKDNEILFVEINLPRYEEKKFLLRRLIREIYLSIIDADPKLEKLKSSNPKLAQMLEILYIRTFYEVLDTQKSSTKKETSLTSSLEFDMKSMIDTLPKIITSILVLIPVGMVMKANVILNWFNASGWGKYIDISVFVLICVYASIKSISLSKKITSSNTLSRDIDVKTLYDDEIAEHHLQTILSEIYPKVGKLVFIIDELDKIDEDGKVETLINDLKPIMLSGMANFILVSGQRLYYKYQTSHTTDDAVISSIFSKSVHVPLLTIDALKSVFSNIVIEKESIDDSLLDSYVKSIILRSNRVPRRFLNLIRQDLVWKDNVSYLNIDESISQTFDTDSKLLDIIKGVEDNSIKSEKYAEGINDFFAMQLNIWVQRMKLKGKDTRFTKDSIYEEQDYLYIDSKTYRSRLTLYLAILLNKLVEEGLLTTEVENEVDEETVTYYKWSETVEILSEIDDRGMDASQFEFIERFISIEKLIKILFNKYISDKNPRVSLSSMLGRLQQKSIINDDVVGYIKSISKVRNGIMHGQKIQNADKDTMDMFNDRFITLKYSVLESYVHYELSNLAVRFDYKIQKSQEIVLNTTMYPFDFKIYTGGSANIFVEVKYRRSKFIEKSMLKTLLDRLEKYNNETNTRNHLIISLFFQSDGGFINRYKEAVDELLSQQYSDIRDNVFVYISSENALGNKENDFYEFMEGVLNRLF